MSLKICIAEDNYFLYKAIAEKLSFFDDITIKFHANNGAELIGKLEEDHNVDVVLMDIQMPVMDGIEATKRIRKLEGELSKTPVIGLTAEAFKERHISFKQAGMDDIVTKPVTVEALQESLLKLALNKEVPDNS